MKNEKEFEFVGSTSETFHDFTDSFVRFNRAIPSNIKSYYFEVLIKVEKSMRRVEEFHNKEVLQLVVGLSTKDGTFFWLNPEQIRKERDDNETIYNFSALQKGDVLTCCIRREKNEYSCRLWRNGSPYGPCRFIGCERILYPTVGLNTNRVFVEVNLGKRMKGKLLDY